jgi:hypothetical protein
MIMKFAPIFNPNLPLEVAATFKAVLFGKLRFPMNFPTGTAMRYNLLRGETMSRSILLVLVCSILIGASCAQNGIVPQWTGSGFLKPEFSEYGTVAILPFEGDENGEVSDTFALSFSERFPKMEVVTRKHLLKVFRVEDFFSDRLAITRKNIRKAFGAEILIKGSVYYPSILRWILQVMMVDLETDEVLGRSMVEINYIGAERVKEGCRFAVQELRAR